MARARATLFKRFAKDPLPPRSAVRSALGICLTGLALAGSVGVSRDVYAKPPAAKGAKQPIGVGGFSGPQAPKVRGRVLKVLRDSGSYEITDVEDVKPGASTATYQQMAQGINAEAIVVGTVSNAGNLTLGVYGSNGARIEAVQIKGGTFPKLYKAIDNEVEIAVADPLAKAHSGKGTGAAAATAAAPAASKAAKPADEEEEDLPSGKAAPAAAASAGGDEGEGGDEAPSGGDDSSSDASSSTSAGPSEKGLRPLELSLGVRGYNRNFKYTEPVWADGTATPPRTLYPYSLALAPTVWIAGRFYPGALFGNGPFSHLGIMFRYELGFGTTADYQSSPPAGSPPTQTVVTQLKTKASEYQIGLRARLPLGAHELGIFGLYGNHSFVLSGDEDPNKGNGAPYAVVPDVHYHYLRFGLDARFRFGKLMLGAQVAPRFLTAMKEIDKAGVWFPGATGSGLDFGAMAGFQLLPWLMPAIGVDMVRYGFDFNNLPVNPKQTVVAGGATDTYLSGWLGVIATFDFGGGATDGGASVDVTPSESEPEKAEEPEEPKAEPKPAAKAKAQSKASDEDEDDAPAPKSKPPAKPKKGASAPVEEEEEEGMD